MKKTARSWFWTPPVEQEVDEELAFHLEMHTRDLIANGMAPDAADEAARQRLGDFHRLRRTCVSLGRKRNRMMRITQGLDELRDDVVVAIRRLKQSPGFAAVAVLTLALGIGANSVLFALADATLLRPLPFADANRLVMIHEQNAFGSREVVGPYEVIEWAARNRTFEAMTVIWQFDRTMVGADGSGELIKGQQVNLRFFEIFRVAPIAGRTFIASDDHANPDAVVVSERLWRDRFGSEPALVGRRIRIDGDTFTVIGIAPAGFQVLTSSDVWTLAATPFMRSRQAVGHYARAVGRLAPGATLEAARADMAAVADSIAKERPEQNKGHGVFLEPLHDGLVNTNLRLTAKLLLGVVAFVLLTCCANVANLVLARTSSRSRELGVRAALGAGAHRIARLLLTESLVLAALAAALGALLGAAILDAAPALLPPGVLPVDVVLRFDGRVLAFCAAAAVALALLFGIAPAWQASRRPPLHAIGSGARTSTGGGSRFRSVLATSQVAAAVLLLCGAGLLARSLVALVSVDSGSRASDALTMTIGVPFVRPDAPDGTRYKSAESRLRFFEDVEREVEAVPGVRRVTFGSALPLDGWWIGYMTGRPGDARPEGQRDLAAYMHVGPAYFDTLDIPLIAGRTFTSADRAGGALVCVVDDTFVKAYLRDRSPIGAHVVVRGWTTGPGSLPDREIVGVVRSVKISPDEPGSRPHLYVPFAQDPPARLSLVVVPSGVSAAALVPSIRAAIARVDRERPVQNVRTIAGIRRVVTSPARFRTALVGAFALLALTLAIIGVFGVLTYSVQQRVREFGVRIALGATTRDVLALVFRSTGRMIGVGIVVGLLAAAAMGRSISALLFGVQPLDPLTFAIVPLILASTAAIATMLPALRAARVNPVVALRDE
jgi:putative ABC transport system permease protein